MPYRKTQLGATARPLALAQNPDAPDLHFHDLRGTAATKFYIGGLSVRVIAEVMAWEKKRLRRSSAATSADRRRRRHSSRSSTSPEREHKL